MKAKKYQSMRISAIFLSEDSVTVPAHMH